MDEMGRLMDEMTREGTLVSTAGLRPTKEGVRVRSRHGKLSTTEGPFTETKEVIGGYAILEAKSKEEALELTKRFLEVHGDEWNLECEVRPLDGPEFGGMLGLGRKLGVQACARLWPGDDHQLHDGP